MEFWLSYNNFAEKLQLPVNPGEFSFKVGNKNEIVDIQDLGEINLPGGLALAELEIASHFPAHWQPYCGYQGIPQPYDAVAQIDKWRQAKQPIRLIITDTPINLPMLVEGFTYGEKGGTRDVNYTLQLKEYRYVQITKVGSSSGDRPGTNTAPQTYTVQEGDSLWLIARKIWGDGSKWTLIYDANRSLIKNPNLIYPGWVLTIPSGSVPAADNSISNLQRELNQMLGWNIAVDGIKGPETNGAIRKFQEVMGLAQDAIVGPLTQGAINQVMARPMLRYGCRGYAVRLVQYRTGAAIDGIFGANTLACVKQFQSKNGLQVDGIVGPETWKKLLG